MIQAKIYVRLKPGVLDPQGKAVQQAIGRIGLGAVEDVRVGKFIEMKLEGDRASAEKQLKEICERLLANTVIEEYRFDVQE